MAIPTYPLAVFRPNWADGIVERLSWLTSVAASTGGEEQRRQIRLTPRRSFEINYNRVGRERTFFDLWMMNFGASECFLPLWHDQAKLTAAASIGDDKIELDTTLREFQIGGYAVLVRDSFNYEIIEIADMDDTGIDLGEYLAKAWPKNTTVYPLRVARIDPETKASALSSRVNDATLLFTLADANPIDEGDWSGYYEIAGKPVFTIEPNRSDSLDTSYIYNVIEQDEGIGLVRRVAMKDTPATGISYNWWAKGREQRYALRQMLYRLAGQFRSVYVPTFSDDAVVALSAAAGAKWLTIQNIGYHIAKAIPGGLSEDDELSRGRRRLLFRANGQWSDAFIYSSEDGGDTEELTLHGSSQINTALPAGTVGMFVELMRLNQDEVEIHHHTDADGIMEVSAAFKTLIDDDPAPKYGNWQYRIHAYADVPGGYYSISGQLYGPFQGTRPNGAGGYYLNFIDLPALNSHNYNEFREVNDQATNDNLRGQLLWTLTGGPYDFVATLYNKPPPGNWQITTQYPAGTYGAVGLDGSTFHVKVKSWDSEGYAEVTSGGVGGLWPYYWYWSES